MFRWMYVCLENNVIHEKRFLWKVTYRVEEKKTEKLTMKTIVLPKSLFIFQNIPFCVNTLYKSLNKLQKVSVDQTI